MKGLEKDLTTRRDGVKNQGPMKEVRIMKRNGEEPTGPRKCRKKKK